VKMKKLWSFLTGKSHQPKLWPANCQCALILKSLCEGELVGGKEACKIIGSHNGARRLNQVRARLRANGVSVSTYYKAAKRGNKFKLSWLNPTERPAARKLITGKVA
jgi:hypothetical protein